MPATTWVYHDDRGNESDPITATEWKRRYAAHLVSTAAVPEAEATERAEEGYRLCVDNFRCSPSDGLTDPVDAAEDELAEAP